MSAVSAESPESAADLSAQPNGRSSAQGAAQPAPADDNAASTDFGPNEWLVDELYQRYQADPGSVDRAWWNFFADYHPKPPDQPRAATPPAAQAGPAPSAAAAATQSAPGAPGTPGASGAPARPAPPDQPAPGAPAASRAPGA